MQVDKITLQDIGLFDNEDHIGLASHLNFCKSNGGEIYLNQFLHHPLSVLPVIQQRQQALKAFIGSMEQMEQMKITNGTCLIIEKFFETSFKNIPVQISLPGAYWYQFWNKADYSLIKYSVEHLVLFVQNLMDFIHLFEKEENNPVIETLVQKINKLLRHPDLVYLKEKQKISSPQQILSLGYSFTSSIVFIY